MNISIKLSCKELEQRISVRKLSNGIYTVKLITTKDNIVPQQAGMVICWNFTDYEKAIEKYLSLATEQAKHIALMSMSL